MSTEVIVSKHAKKRIKERCGVSKRAAERLAKMAANRGIDRESTKGSLRKWLDEKSLRSDIGSRILVWGDKAYIFSDSNVMITCLQIPSEITRNMKKMIVQPA